MRHHAMFEQLSLEGFRKDMQVSPTPLGLEGRADDGDRHRTPKHAARDSEHRNGLAQQGIRGEVAIAHG